MRRAALFLLLSVMLAACDYPVRNQALTSANAQAKYELKYLPDGDDTLVIVTASGGGTRAAALAMSVLQAMDRIKLPSGQSLTDKVDIVSSVSGGSVTAGYFALYGKDGFDTLESSFLRRDGMSPLIGSILNPFSLAVLSTPSKERIDLLIDYLDRQLFQGKTFEDLVQRRRRPYLILNAADMVEGVPFPFTTYTMNLLCSDLGTMKLSTAVAASAAFPVALSPVTLKNYCTPSAPGRAPGVRDALQSSWYVNPSRVAWARAASAYASGSKQYIHLLDGGIADNLGVAEPYRMLTGGDNTLDLINDMGQGKIKKVVFVMVNARSFKPSGLDSSPETPGLLDMALGSVDSSIDRATFSTAERLRTLLLAELEQFATQAQDPKLKANLRAVARNTTFLPVDFDGIRDEKCRQAFHSIATSWSLSGAEIDALKKVGGALLGNDQDKVARDNFAKMLKDVGGHVDGQLPTIEDACRTVQGAG